MAGGVTSPAFSKRFERAKRLEKVCYRSFHIFAKAAFHGHSFDAACPQGQACALAPVS